MDMQRKYVGRSAMGRDGGQSRILTIGLPLPYEGVGKALHKSFSCGRGDLPDDMLDLLAKLDRA